MRLVIASVFSISVPCGYSMYAMICVGSLSGKNSTLGCEMPTITKEKINNRTVPNTNT